MEAGMRRNASVTLGSHYDDFIDSQIKDGSFCSRSEVVRAGLNLLEMHLAKTKALKHAIEIGLNSESVECSYEDFMAELEQEDGLAA
jgi:antitoxin ParD1/3/4